MSTSVVLLNALRSDASQMYQDYVPVATKDNLALVGAAINEHQTVYNEFTALINKIAKTFTTKRMYDNPLARFKMGKLETASEVEEYFITKIKSTVQSKNGDKTLVPQRLRTSTTYYKENRQETYKATRSFKQARQAFTTSEGVMAYLDGVVSELSNSDNIDEYYIMRKLISNAGNTAGFTVPVGDIQTNEGAKKMIRDVKVLSLNFTEPSSEYHNATYDDGTGIVHDTEVITNTPKENQVMFITHEAYADLDVSALSSAIHLDKLAMPNNIIPLGDLGEDKDGNTILAIITDDRLLRVWDTFNMTLTNDNGEGAFTNYFKHVDQILGISPYSQIAVFSKAPEEPAA